MNDNEIFSLVIVTVIIMVVMALGILLLFNVSQKRIFIEVAKSQEKEITFQQQLLASNIETQEKERNKIARELHDEICSKLNVVHLNLNLLSMAIDKGNETSEIFDQINSSLNSSIVRTRDISHNLMPPVLAKFGIQSALNSLVTGINLTGALRINCNTENEWGDLTKMEELHFYRIIQELLNNTLKHSRASNASIVIDLDDERLEIKYKDDGIGIEKKDFEKKVQGLGLHNIMTRLKLLNAEQKINFNKKNGFEINITRKL